MMKKLVQKLFKLLTSKIFLIFLAFLLLFIISILFWFYVPLLTFNEKHLFTQNYQKIIILSFLWFILIFIFIQRQLKTLVLQKILKRQRDISNLKSEASAFLSKTKRNFTIAIKDAKNTWKQKINFKKLPLIMVMGEEGAGKSSLINYSGLEYPISDLLGSYKKYHLSTKNFTFYISKNGVLIDTEGSYFSFENYFYPINTDEIPEDDLERNKDYLLRKMIWNRFIHFLNKSFFRKKLNGIAYVIDTQKLLNSSREEVKRGIYSLVKRVGECEHKLNLKLPIYIIFTKLDLIDGMGDFVKLYGEKLNKKALGITFPAYFNFHEEEVHQYFEELSKSIKYALMIKNHNNSTIQAKNKSYLFFKQLENLFAIIEEFLQNAYLQNNKNRSFIRGVYFTSSYQENIPNNFMVNSVCYHYDVKPPIATNITSIQKQSYFVHSLLEDIIFKDVGLSQNILGSFWKKTSAYLIGFLTLGVTIYLANYFISQKNLQKDYLRTSALQIERAIDDLQILYPKVDIEKKSIYTQNLKNILTLYPQIFHETSWIDYLRLNFAYQAFYPAKEFYLERSEDLLRLSLINEFEKILLEDKNPEKVLETLYFYKMIIQRKYLEKELMATWVKNHWQLFEKYRIPKKIFVEYLQQLTQKSYWDVKENEQAINQAKASLANFPRSKRIYTLLSLRAQNQGMLNLRTEVGGSFDEVFDIDTNSYLIPKSYTKDGAIDLMTNINRHIDEIIKIEHWLLESQISSSNEEEKIILSMDIIKLYTQEYIQKWQDILSNIKPKPFINTNAGLGILKILSRTNNPVKSLIEVISKNTQLLQGNELINQAINTKLPVADFKSIFEALNDSFNLYHYIANEDSILSKSLSAINDKIPQKNEKIMRKISQDIDTIYKKIIDFSTESLSSQEKIFYALKKPSNIEDPFVILEADNKSLPTEVAQYYSILSSYAWNIIEKQGTRELDIAWNKELYTPFIDQIASTYPINVRSKKPININAFRNFFGKQGIWDKFFTQYLSQILIKKAGIYQVDPTYAKKLNFSNDFLAALTKISTIANEILDFNNNLDIKFSIKILALSGDYGKIIISYNDKKAQYDHTLSPTIEFIADMFLDDTSLLIQTFDYQGQIKQQIEFNGQWAWLELIQSASNKGDKYTVVFEKNPKLYFDFKVISGKTTLKRVMDTLPYLKLPQNILK